MFRKIQKGGGGTSSGVWEIYALDLRVMDSFFHSRRRKASREFIVDALRIINHMDNQEQPGTKPLNFDPQGLPRLRRFGPQFSARLVAQCAWVTKRSRLP